MSKNKIIHSQSKGKFHLEQIKKSRHSQKNIINTSTNTNFVKENQLKLISFVTTNIGDTRSFAPNVNVNQKYYLLILYLIVCSLPFTLAGKVGTLSFFQEGNQDSIAKTNFFNPPRVSNPLLTQGILPYLIESKNECTDKFKPLDFAKLALWVYEEDFALPSGIQLLETVIIENIKFVYFKLEINPENAINVFAIRGTNNSENAWQDAHIILKSGKIPDYLQRSTKKALASFEEKFGRCSVAVGHSLGGKLLEAIIDDTILGISFNAYLNNRHNNIIAYRIAGDPADMNVSHTTHTIPADYFAVPNPIKKHSMQYVVEQIDDENIQWETKDIDKMNIVLPNLDNSEKGGCTDIKGRGSHSIETTLETIKEEFDNLFERRRFPL